MTCEFRLVDLGGSWFSEEISDSCLGSGDEDDGKKPSEDWALTEVDKIIICFFLTGGPAMVSLPAEFVR